MNKIYRIVWNEARGAFIVAHEKSKANGKPSSTRKAIASAVVMALAAMAAEPALATTSCNLGAGTITVTGAESLCVLVPGESLMVSASGSITYNSSTKGAVVGNQMTTTGSIINNGLVSNSVTGTYGTPMGFGIHIAGSTFSGGITNTGTILGNGQGIAVVPDANHINVIGVISNSGTISSGLTGLAIGGGQLAGITNSGNITATYFVGLFLSGDTMTGSITNSTTGTISGGSYGYAIGTSTISGSITNNGKITAGVHAGISLIHSTVSGGITNSGSLATISGTTGPGINIDATSQVVNAALHGVGLANLTAATISGGIKNAGLISGASSGIKIASAGSLVSGGLTNSGTISASIYAGIQIVHGTVTGGITNSGAISGSGTGGLGSAGIHVNSFGNINGGIINQTGGNISGNEGIYVSYATLSGGINNNGTITGVATGIRTRSTGTISGDITNSGTISGGLYAVYVDPTSSLSGITITGANTAKFGGDVFAKNAPVTITSGSTFTGANAFNVQSFNIASTGVFDITNTMPGVGTTTGAISNAGITVTQGVTNAGTISVAEGITGHITGNYTQASTGIYQLGASSSTSYGKLAVSGTANLAGTAYVNVNSVNTIASGQTLSGVITSSGLTGNFASVNTNSNLFGFSTVANGNNVDLCIFSAGSSCGAGGSSSSSSTPSTVITDTKANGNNPGAGAAVVFDNLIAQGNGAPAAMAPVITALGKLTTSQEVSNAVAQTLPLHTGGETAAVTGSLHSVNHIVQSREEGQQGRSSGDGFIEDGKVWVKPFGSLADQGDYQGVSGFKALTGGIVFGADADFSSTSRIGIALATANTDVSGNSAIAPQSSNVATYQLALYGSHSLNENTDFNFQADLGDHINKGNRGIPFMGTTAQSNYHSLSEQLGAGIAYTMKLSEVSTFTPTARVDYTTVHNNGYTESGAGALDLIVDSSTVNEMIISADGKFTHNLNEGSIVTANLGVGYDVLNKQSSIVSAFAGDPTATFTTLGLNPSPWIARGGLGFVRTEKTTEVTLRYDVDASTSHFVGQTVSARFRWSF